MRKEDPKTPQKIVEIPYKIDIHAPSPEGGEWIIEYSKEAVMKGEFPLLSPITSEKVASVSSSITRRARTLAGEDHGKIALLLARLGREMGRLEKAGRRDVYMGKPQIINR